MAEFLMNYAPYVTGVILVLFAVFGYLWRAMEKRIDAAEKDIAANKDIAAREVAAVRQHADDLMSAHDKENAEFKAEIFTFIGEMRQFREEMVRRLDRIERNGHGHA